MNKEDVPVDNREEWTIERLKTAKLLVEDGTLKEPSEICGVVQFSVWDFNEVDQVVYPVLHSEIGLVNDALDSFYDFIDDNIEVLTDYEKVAWNQLVLADVALETAVERRNNWRNNEGIEVSVYEVFIADAMEALKQHGISREEWNQLQRDKKEVEECILRLKNEKKAIEEDIEAKRAAFLHAKKSFKDIRGKNSRPDWPVRAEIINILE
jgi:hypothetical protein